jgi:hypothetical protein
MTEDIQARARRWLAARMRGYWDAGETTEGPDTIIRDLLAAVEMLSASRGLGRGTDDPAACPFGNVNDCCGHHAVCVAAMRRR